MIIHNYEEANDIKDCNKTLKKYSDKHEKCNGRSINAFQVFKVLMDTGDKLITPMAITGEVSTTQFYYKVGDYMALEYNERDCRLQEYVEKGKNQYTYPLGLEPLLRIINTSILDLQRWHTTGISRF